MRRSRCLLPALGLLLLAACQKDPAEPAAPTYAAYRQRPGDLIGSTIPQGETS